ncbi:ORF6N domain-containing protein [Modicisalibacter xianhensis]|uniref:ORF6N domain-containing protein n=1 Tax=Modicisalibacter xianhensis TaxID=442341 RepID=A0A4R8FYM8_9GAMM|nr:ORF6N domain-containing protein [Halomonas xianhensis]TDX30750.1 ORF6N domain-containing protein [Halomonas xianhensis]
MTHSITTVTPDNVPQLTFDGKPVVTTAVLAQLYGAEQKHIQNNYKRNEPRFEHGKHYYKVEGSDLKDLKNKPSLRGLVGNRAKSLTLWTERGAARHAKMLETNAAWDVFEALEDNYFDQSRNSCFEDQPKSLSRPTVKDRAPLKALVNTIVDVRARKGQPSDYSMAWREVNSYLGVEHIKDASHEQVEQGVAFARRILEGEVVETTPALPQAGLSEEERHDLFLLGTHIGWALRYWTDYSVESSLTALGSQAGTRIGEHLKVAGLYGRRILREHAELMSVSKSRLGLDHLTSL